MTNSSVATYLRIAALIGLAVAQPLFDVLGLHATFFVARQSEPVDLYGLAAFLSVGLWLGAVCVLWLAGVASRRLHDPLVAILLTLLFAALWLPLAGRVASTSTWGGLLLALFATLGSLAAYRRSEVVRNLLALAAPITLIFPILFLRAPSISVLLSDVEGSAATRVSDAPESDLATVVMLVFDELPVTSLLDENRQVDRILYPNFYRLSQRSLWLRNATTVSGYTEAAVPAIVSGSYPVFTGGVSAPARKRVYRHTLFSLLKRSHEVIAYEGPTFLAPRLPDDAASRVPPRFPTGVAHLLSDVLVIYAHVLSPPNLRALLPTLSGRWHGFSEDRTSVTVAESASPYQGRRPAVVQDFLDKLSRRTKPALYYLHVDLPHQPFEYLPSGQRYGPVLTMTEGVIHGWVHELAAEQAYRRHLLQAQFADKLLGDILDKLEEEGIFEECLLVAVSDHGISFSPELELLPRNVDPSTIQDILPVVLMIKVPDQQRGRVDDRAAQTVDILPTILDWMEIDSPVSMDGVSLLQPEPFDGQRQAVMYHSSGRIEAVTLDVEAAREALERKLDLFGSGEQFAPYALGDSKDLIGRYVEDLPVVASPLSVDMKYQFLLVDVDPDGPFLPAFFVGQILGGAAGREVVIALNGVVQAVPLSVEHGWFWSLVSADSFRSGPNQLDVYTVEGKGADATLFSLRLEPETYPVSMHNFREVVAPPP